MIDYIELLKKTWNDVKTQPMVFAPMLFYIVTELIFFIVLLTEFFYMGFSTSMFTQQTLTEFNFSQIMLILSFVMIVIALLTLLKAYIGAMQCGAYLSIIKKQKISFSSLLSSAKKYFFRVLSFYLLMLLLYLIIVMIYLGIPFLLGIVYPLAFFLLIPGFFLFFIALLFIGLCTLFALPLLILENKSAWQALQGSFHFFFAHLLQVFMVGLILFVLMLIVTIPLMIPSFMLNVAAGFNILFRVFSIALNVLQSLLGAIVGVYAGLYIFNAYSA